MGLDHIRELLLGRCSSRMVLVVSDLVSDLEDAEESRKDERGFGDIDESCQFGEKETSRRGHGFGTMCKSRYPVHFVAVDVKSMRTIVEKAFSVPKCVRLTRMSKKSYELLCKMFSAVPERTKEELESILGRKFMGYVSGASLLCCASVSAWGTPCLRILL